MPYDPNNPPEKISKLSPKKQRQWVAVFNSAFKSGADEASAHKQAWGAVKKDDTLSALTSFNTDVQKMGIVSDARKLISGKTPGATPKPSVSGMGHREAQIGEVREWGGKKMKKVGPDKWVPVTDGAKKSPKASGIGSKMSKYENLPAPTLYSEAKMDSKTGEMVVTGKHRGKKLQTIRVKPDDVDKMPTAWKRHMLQIASSLNDDAWKDVINKIKAGRSMEAEQLRAFSKAVASGSVEKSKKKDSVEEAISAQLENIEEAPKVDVSEPGGARAMALALSRIFGGWKGGCRLSPSANRLSMYHMTVFCADGKELGERILQMKQHLLTDGYKEESEGIFRNGNRSVFQGRSYSRRKGNKPLAFMITVDIKNK